MHCERSRGESVPVCMRVKADLPEIQNRADELFAPRTQDTAGHARHAVEHLEEGKEGHNRRHERDDLYT